MSNRDIEAARAYHEDTKHSEARLRAGPHSLDWDNRPIPFKLYGDLEPIPLPREVQPGDVSTLGALHAHGRGATSETRTPDLRDLARVLYYSAGVTKVRRSGDGEFSFRAAPSTGALYHIDLYAACGDIAGLAAGVYHYGPHDHALRRLREGDHRAAFVEAAGAEPTLARAPVIVASASTYWRNAWKYRSRTYRHCFWDGGALHAHALAVGAALGLVPQVVAGFVDAQVGRLLGLDPRREGALTLVPVGRASEPPPPAPGAAALILETVALSPSEVEYPDIADMHEASSLGAPDEVVAWRGGLRKRTAPASAGMVVSLLPLPESEWPAEPLESVIRRRGSTRQFDPSRSLTLEELSTALTAAAAPIAADFLDGSAPSLLDLYLIVHAVEGLPSGAYYLRRDDRVLELLREGDFRVVAGRLGLFQELPAAAAANVYCMAALEPILERFGNRGYRAAQLEGGIVGGRLYLAAYALGFGATGLTFLDDEVTEFFSPHGAGKSVMFLTALGRSVRRR